MPRASASNHSSCIRTMSSPSTTSGWVRRSSPIPVPMAKSANRELPRVERQLDGTLLREALGRAYERIDGVGMDLREPRSVLGVPKHWVQNSRNTASQPSSFSRRAAAPSSRCTSAKFE
jgi:hypothetical protein